MLPDLAIAKVYLANEAVSQCVRYLAAARV